MYIPLRYWLGYAVCVCLAISAVIEEAQQDEWISLISHAAFVVTALYSYRQQRYDLAALTLIVTGTSLVWHSSGKFQEVDSVFTSIAALYAYATTVLPPFVAAAPVVLFSVLNGSDDSFALFAPLIVLLILYKIVALVAHLPKPLTLTFFLAVVAGGVGLVCYSYDNWHSMWHVLAALAIALTIEPAEPPKALVIRDVPVGVPVGTMQLRM